MADGQESVRLTAWVGGHVQGVGFRFWVREQADGLGLLGSATNLPDGRVHIVAEGTKSACEALLDPFAEAQRTRSSTQRVGGVDQRAC